MPVSTAPGRTCGGRDLPKVTRSSQSKTLSEEARAPSLLPQPCPTLQTVNAMWPPPVMAQRRVALGAVCGV